MKKILIWPIVCFLLFLVVIVVRFNFSEKRRASYEEITREASLNIEVSSFIEDHGSLTINNQYSIIGFKLINSSSEVSKLSCWELPFHLVKENDNDTIKFYKNSNKLVLILKDDSFVN